MFSFFRKKRNKSKYSTLKPQPSSSLKNLRKSKGTVSINENRSPYLHKFSFLKFKRKPRLKSFSGLSNSLTPPARLKQSGLPRVKKILLILLFCLIAISCVYIFFFTDFFEVHEYKIFEDDIQITNNLQLNETVGESLRKQNIFLFNQELLIKKVLDQNPEYKTIKIDLLLPHTVRVTLIRFPITANVINEIISADGPKILKKFIVNSNGMIIQENEENPDLPYLRLATDKAFQLGDFPLNHDTLEYAIQLVPLFEEKFGIHIVEAVILKKAREIHLFTDKNFVVWFDLTQSINSQVDKLKRALVKLDIYNTPLEYIDLRINGVDSEKVIFKPRR